MTHPKLTLLITLAASTLLLAGCTTTSKVNTNVADTNATANTNTTNTMVVANDNVNTNVDQGSPAGWNNFSIPQLGVTLNLPFESDKVNFSESTCQKDQGCDYDGYGLFGAYDVSGQRSVGFLGSVSEQWSPSRDNNLYEVYDLAVQNGDFTVIYGNGGKKQMEKPVSEFIVNGHQIAIFDIDYTDNSGELTYHSYLGVAELSTDKYKAFAISLDKSTINETDFINIMESIQFTNS